MKTINLLIIASSDMNGTDENLNRPDNVIDVAFPCAHFEGKAQAADKISTAKSPRCIKCRYTQVEHKYGYPIYPLNPVKLQVGETVDTGKPVYSHSEYSDFWRNRSIIFERLKLIFGTNINIKYHTMTPMYTNDTAYLPTITKMNSIVARKLRLNGTITYAKPYHFSCLLNELQQQPDYKGIKYDCIFVVSGGLGWLYTPDNFKEMSDLLKPNAKPAVIGNLWYKPVLEQPEFKGMFKFMNPINSCLNDDSVMLYDKKDVKQCIKNYSDIILNDKFVEMYEMLVRA